MSGLYLSVLVCNSDIAFYRYLGVGGGFYNARGAGERQPPAVFFPEPQLFRPLSVTVGCSGDTVLARGRLRQRVVQAHF